MIEVNFGKNLKRIGHEAFAYCRSLKSIDIPASCEGLGQSSFYSCYSLVTINLRNISTISIYAFSSCAVVHLNLETVYAVYDNAFQYCKNLETVKFGKNLYSLGDYAFLGCILLSSVTIPDNVTSLYGTFCGCNSLKEVNFGKLLKFGGEAFESCIFTNITLPSTIETLETYAFSHCNELETVILNAEIRFIEKYAFYNCENIMCVYYLGNSSPNVHDDAFYGSTFLRKVNTIASYFGETFGDKNVSKGVSIDQCPNIIGDLVKTNTMTYNTDYPYYNSGTRVNSNDNDQSDNSNTTAIAVGVTVPLVVIIVAAAVGGWIYYRNKNQKDDAPVEEVNEIDDL
ncbi:leucine-rich repeat domain-containing protein [Histomonas meleagridis]|uniref:leucine-rich repeat domain-containing protein n=1 Tax=Histomonas meleagridis TaxID=135588 RepID=UPI00355A22EB|nr:leucine-rich repeat domain-containing protein [Histomonas meleagridis]KAH0805102.1 leucine-rich repeat domain-containing protein [Histomonas meleagridis]